MDFFFGPVLICTISSNISNDSTQLKFSFNIFLWKICRQYPRAEVLLVCLCFPWPPDEHQIVQFILAFKGTATCLHWLHQEVVPLFASDHSWQKGKHFGWRQVLMFMVSHQTLHRCKSVCSLPLRSWAKPMHWGWASCLWHPDLLPVCRLP